MAKPDDTRITHAPANAAPASTLGNTASNTLSNTVASTTLPPIPLTSSLTPVLQALLARVAHSQAAPQPPKFARPSRIKPRRRVTVSTSVSPDGDANTPWIRLCGQWLLPAGFALHTRVRVHVADGFMLLIAEEQS